ncbi:MAG: aldehyde ferredoxin oxidoreductase [Candidatus Abyssobacteria bacterium SURF_17]|uniref:Aldehyde ferredoxin oxidoreductase n=1 Tax=Candidatus Abyssobacteria bacterium SURF_17 TaxID=2093361 RepID=A0A419ESW9_9BACT|nr:MAG: aldehyde ferredoxin oxidoreductase [Candidatus Abyssubacteria bacterium SURF_17]
MNRKEEQMPNAYMGKVLWADLTTGKIWAEDIPEQTYREFLCGYGLGAKIVYDRQPPKVDALGPDAILGFTTGLLTGTGAPFTGRYMVVGKSPLTGTWGDANSGGHFSPMLKRTGYDAVFVKGKSEKPVVLVIREDKAELVDASFVWGKDCVETEDLIREKLGDKKYQIACIGPAGEKLSLISGVITDKGRAAGRSGLGAVMGSKKLKAIAALGDKKTEIADPDTFSRLRKSYLEKFKRKPPFKDKTSVDNINFMGKMVRSFFPFLFATPPATYKELITRYGTAGMTAYSAECGDSPVKNWGGSGYHDFPIDSKSSRISDANVVKYQEKRYFCAFCPLGCGGIVKVKQGEYAVEEGHKPEYETLGAFGTMCLNDDIESIIAANDICNRAGLDTISAGATIAFAIECYENGIITDRDTDGLKLTWGNADAIVKMTKKIAARSGFGDVLADGVKRAAERIGKGSEKFAVHAGGQELPMHDPRFDPTFGTAYEVEPTPGRHTISSDTYVMLMELHRKFKHIKPFKQVSLKSSKYNYSRVGEHQTVNSTFVQVANGAGACLFGLLVGEYPLFEWINAATGWKLDTQAFLTIGERILTLRHCFNVREGIKPVDTQIRNRAGGYPPLKKGPLADVTLDLDTMASRYYQKLGWNYQTGIPDKQRLQSLGLTNVVKDLYRD